MTVAAEARLPVSAPPSLGHVLAHGRQRELAEILVDDISNRIDHLKAIANQIDDDYQGKPEDEDAVADAANDVDDEDE